MNFLQLIVASLIVLAPAAACESCDDRSEQTARRAVIARRLEKYFEPPAEFAGQFGTYRSPLRFADGSAVKSAADWPRRRAEILETWHRRLGNWPPLVDRPLVTRLKTTPRDGFVQHHVHVQITPDGKLADGYLLVPDGQGPFPAVLVPFYEPQTSIGDGANGRGRDTHDYGLQLVRRGFVTLSIGTPGSVETPGLETRQLLGAGGIEQKRQPLTYLAYVAANCHTALAQMPEVDAARIGIIGLSYGGKWSMFASCLYEKFACAVWSDPGIVFNEQNANVNYWEPWYLGYEADRQRKPGVPSADNSRTGLYKQLIESGDDLVDLHALMAPRPVLVSGGTEDPPRNWQALNHLVAVNELLGHKHRVALTARPTHVPTAEALELELSFLEYWLKTGGSTEVVKPFGERGASALRVFAGSRGADAPRSPNGVTTSTDTRLPRDNLLVYRGDDGEVRPVRTVADWQKRRAEIIRGMETVMGKLPGDEKRCPLDLKVEEEADCGSYVRRFITYSSEPGSRVPAYLLVPKAVLDGGGRAPAVLCLHPTDNVVGNKVVVGLGGKANRQYAAELAERGYVTLAPSYPLLANYQPNIGELGWKSGTLKAVWDNMRGLDLLESLPFVKPGGFGAIGHSLGGHNSVYTAVIDSRIQAVVSSCGLDSYLDYYGGDDKLWLPEKGWCQTRYMLRLADYRGRLADIPFDFHELIGALAPRPVFISAPIKDSNFRHDSVDRIVAAASQIYKLHGQPARLRVEHPDCDHDFPDAMRSAAYELFDEVLR